MSVQAERGYLASERYRYLVAYSDSQLAGFIAIRDGSTFFTSLSSAHISSRALLGACGSEPCASCVLPAAMEPLRLNSSFSAVPVASFRFCSSRVITECAWHLVSAHAASGIASMRPNQSMQPIARPGNEFCAFATTPCRGLSLSR